MGKNGFNLQIASVLYLRDPSQNKSMTNFLQRLMYGMDRRRLDIPFNFYSRSRIPELQNELNRKCSLLL